MLRALALVLLAVAACAGDAPATFDCAWWAWDAAPPTADDLSILRALPTRPPQLRLAGAVGRAPTGWTWTPMGGPLGLPEPIRELPVVRLDGAATAALARGDDPEGLAAFVVARIGVVAGVQIDADVPTRALARHAAFLRALRARLPACAELSATMLLDWARAVDLAELARAVDWLAPQFYTTRAPASPDDAAVADAVALPGVAASLERAGARWRIGLPTVAIAAVFAADGTRLAATAPLRLEDLLAAGLRIERVDEADERRIHVVCADDVVVRGRRLPRGARVVVAQPTTRGLAVLLARARATGAAGLLGACLYRLPTGGDDGALSLAQAAAAWGGDPTTAHLVARVVGAAPEWRLEVENVGDENLVAAPPGVVRVRGVGPLVARTATLPSASEANPTARGRQASPAHADGLELRIATLRAHATIAIDLRCDGAPVAEVVPSAESP